MNKEAIFLFLAEYWWVPLIIWIFTLPGAFVFGGFWWWAAALTFTVIAAVATTARVVLSRAGPQG